MLNLTLHHVLAPARALNGGARYLIVNNALAILAALIELTLINRLTVEIQQRATAILLSILKATKVELLTI